MFDQIKKYWKNLTRNAQYIFASVAIALCVLTITVFYWLAGSSYQVLFSDLSNQDAATIIRELDSMKIIYKIADDGSKILVKDDVIHETRIKLMGKSLPLNGGVGFEIFDNTDIGMTEYAQKINYQRALQGELARTIMSIRQIKLARIHLVLPETSIFKRNKNKPKASVSLIMRPNQILSQSQIVGIQRLVAAAVQSLEPSMVNLVDQRGVTLSAPIGEKQNIAATNRQLELKRNIETHLTKKIATVLDKAFGPGKAIISVDVTLNFDQIKSKKQDILPVHGTKDSFTGVIVKKRYTSQKMPRQIINTKTASNVNPVSYITNNKPMTNTTSEVEYRVGTRIEEVIKTPGSIQRLSVGVLVPHDLGSDKLGNIKEIVAMTAGINNARGDAIAVYPITQFSTDKARPINTGANDANIVPSKKINQEPTKSVWLARADKITGKISNNYSAHPIVFIVVLFFSFLLISALTMKLVRYIRNVRADKGNIMLSDMERERILKQIKKWLESDNKIQENGTAV